nr:hypothetical protein [Desulfosarcina ovata]
MFIPIRVFRFFIAGAGGGIRRAVSIRLRISVCQQCVKEFRAIPVIRQRFVVQFVDPILIGGGIPAIVDHRRNTIIGPEGKPECGDEIGFLVIFL